VQVVQNRFQLRKQGTYEQELKKPIEATLKKAQEDTRLAQQEVDQVKAEYEAIRSRKMRGFPFDWSIENPDQRNIAVMKEQRENFRPRFLKFIESTGVKLASTVDFGTPTVTLPPLDDPQNGIMRMPPGRSLQLTVTGDYPTLLRFLRSWSGFDRLVRIDSVRISGTSPNLQMQIPLTIYTFPAGFEVTGGAAPEAAGGGAAGGGMGGSMGGGAMGGGAMGGGMGGGAPMGGGMGGGAPMGGGGAAAGGSSRAGGAS